VTSSTSVVTSRNGNAQNNTKKNTKKRRKEKENKERMIVAIVPTQSLNHQNVVASIVCVGHCRRPRLRLPRVVVIIVVIAKKGGSNAGMRNIGIRITKIIIIVTTMLAVLLIGGAIATMTCAVVVVTIVQDAITHTAVMVMHTVRIVEPIYCRNVSV
jgi:hypothetical protein